MRAGRSTVARATAFLALGMGVFACNAILGNEDRYLAANAQQKCVLNSDCKDPDICLFQLCSVPCRMDRDCETGFRCLETNEGSACVSVAQAKCEGTPCPKGTTCAEGECRASCGENTSCLAEQVCAAEGTCVGSDPGHDPLGSVIASMTGAREAGASGGGSSNGGAGGRSGAAGGAVGNGGASGGRGGTGGTGVPDASLGGSGGSIERDAGTDAHPACLTPALDCPAPSACQAASCSPAQVCQETADPTKNGVSCGSALECVNGACKPTCGNGKPNAGEDCDDGNATSGDGCEANCKFTCATATDCTGTVPACSVVICSGTTHVCTSVADASKDGQVCDTGAGAATCHAGACTAGACGNGTVDTGEDCDFGPSNNVHLSGCEPNCKLSCTDDASCNDGNACNGNETCQSVVVGGKTGRHCVSGTALGNGASCGTGGTICLGGQCKTSTCGDGYIDVAKSEACEPPNTPTCGSACDVICDLGGTWAMKVTVNVDWAGSTALIAGPGTFNDWYLVTRTHTDQTFAETLRPCGTSPPDFKSTPIAGSATFGTVFPNAFFDHAPPYAPTSSGSGSVVPTVGGDYAMGAVPFLLGLTMANPLTDAWPAAASVVQTDVDQDSFPGLTITAKSTSGYSPMPTQLSTTPAANVASLAHRRVSAFTGKLASCTQINGSVSALREDWRVLGCKLTTGVTCSSTQVAFVDSNRPAWMPTGGTFTTKRATAGATCADVRALVP